MQYNHRSRLPPQPPPPPPPFFRGGGAGYPRGHKQLYTPPPPPLRPAPSPPQRKYEVLMEAGRLAAEYLVSQGVLPPASLQRGAGSWAAPPPPPPPLQHPPQQQQQEPPAFYGRKRYEDEYTNNPSARPRRTNGSSSTSSRDDYSSGSYNGRWKRKHCEYKRGYSDLVRDREERARAFPNGRRYEDEDEDVAPGFRQDQRGSRGSDEVRSSVTEAVREETSFMVKAVSELEMANDTLKVVSSIGAVKDADASPQVQDENEEGEVDDDSKVLISESAVVEQAIDADATNASTGLMDDDSKVSNSELDGVELAMGADDNNASTGLMESKPNNFSDGKFPGEKAEDDEKNSDETCVGHSPFDVEIASVENDMDDGKRNLLDLSDFARAPTRPRSARAHRNATTVPGETSVDDTVDLVCSVQASQMVVGESAKESSSINTQTENREDQICQEHTNLSVVSDEPTEPMLLHENGASVVTENMREEKGDAQLYVVQEYKEESNLSPFMASRTDSLPQEGSSIMQETDLSPLTDSRKDSLLQEDILMQETDLSHLRASHNDSLIEETELSPSTVSHNESLVQESHLSRAMSSDKNNFKLQLKEGTQICDIDTFPEDVDLIEFSDQRETAGAEAAIKMEEGRMDQSGSLKVSDLDLLGGTEVAALHNNIAFAQSCTAGSSTELHKKHQDDPGTAAGAVANATDGLYQLPLENKDLQVIDVECDTLVEVGDFGSSKPKNEMICSSMDVLPVAVMHPGLDTDVLPGIQDGYSLAYSDFLGGDIPCYPPMESDLHAGIGAHDSEGITMMDDPIYGSLADFGLMDVWGQPAQDFDKFF